MNVIFLSIADKMQLYTIFFITHARGSSKQAWHIPNAVYTVFELLMMGGKSAWNM